MASDGSELPAGLTLALGTTAPARSWSFPFGSAADGRTHTVGVANFGDIGSEVEVATLLDGEQTVEPQVVSVPGRSVVNVDVGEVVPVGSEFAVEVRVTGNAPVVAEELIGASSASGTEGGAALDVGAPIRRRDGRSRAWGSWARPRRRTRCSRSLNPGDGPVTATLLAYTSGDLNSPRRAPERAVDRGGRAVFTLSELGIDPDQVLVVESDGPVFVERLVVTATGRSLSGGIPGKR